MNLTDTLVLVPKGRKGDRYHTEQVVTISRSQASTRLNLSASVLRGIGFDRDINPESRMYSQVFISASTMRITVVDTLGPDVRPITRHGYVTASELGAMLQLPIGSSWRCRAEVVKGKSVEVWATFPPELRAYIATLDGVAR